MKIIINTSTNVVGGGFQISLSLIKECINISNNDYYIFMNENITSSLNISEYPSNFHFYEIPRLKFYQYHNFLSKLEKKINPDIVFTVFGPTYWRPKTIHVMGFAMGHYVYPDSPYWNIIKFKEKVFWFLKKKIHMFYFKRDADGFIVETHDVADRLKRIFNKKCDVVSNTYNHYFHSYHESASKKRFLPNKNNEYRLLFVCTPYLHKNIGIIPKVIDRLLEKGIDYVKFILTININEYKKLIPNKYKNYIVTTGKIDPCNLPQLYSECDFVFVPSLLECFTANFPEAMVMKKPILASDLGYAHSICENSAIYFDPLNSENIADKIQMLIEDIALQNKLIINGLEQLKVFKTAKERAELYMQILEQYYNDYSN